MHDFCPLVQLEYFKRISSMGHVGKYIADVVSSGEDIIIKEIEELWDNCLWLND